MARLYALPSLALSSPEPSGGEAWVHLAHVGEWKGHPSGEFTFTRENLGQIVANAQRQETPIPFKYEHPIAMGQPIPSAGRVKKLELRGDVLWALTAFTERAAAMIRAREYQFCSVVVAFDATDRVTNEPIGALLLEVGLTDTPFIDGQAPIKMMERAA